MHKNIHFISKTKNLDPTLLDSTIEECVEYCKDKLVLGVDTETEGFDFTCKKMIMFQIGDLDKQFVIDTRFVSIEPLRKILESNDITKIFHNAKFDYKFIKMWAGIETRGVYDTFLMEKVINCGKSNYGYSLGKLCERYLNIELDKSTRNQFVGLTGQPFSVQQIVYGAKDVEYLLQLRDKQLPQLRNLDLELVARLENEAVVVFSEIEFEGLQVDEAAWGELALSNVQDAKQAELDLDEFVLTDTRLDHYKLPIQADMFTPAEELRKTHINWNSPSQVLALFHNLEPSLEDVNGKNLYKFRRQHTLIDEYVKYKEKSKLANAYGTNFFKFISCDGKVHTSFQQILDTGRVSSSSPNMQQIPSDNKYRNCFIAPVDWVFVSSDYSSQELNVIAYGSQDPVFLSALENNQDLHSVCADLVFQQEWIDAADDDCAYMESKQKCNCKKHKTLRTSVKTINFGLAYGMGPNKLADTLSITKDEAKKLIEKYFEAFPNIKNFLEKLGDFGKRRGYIRTFKPFKRRRWFSNWYPKMYNSRSNFMELGSIERASKNTPIQGSSADMTKLALIKIFNEIKENWRDDVKIVMTVHDQIDVICRTERAEEWSKKMTELMEDAAKFIITNGLLRADTNISKTWEK
jgi:DNA polymerase-1